jgi:hypothetical protein
VHVPPSTSSYSGDASHVGTKKKEKKKGKEEEEEQEQEEQEQEAEEEEEEGEKQKVGKEARRTCSGGILPAAYFRSIFCLLPRMKSYFETRIIYQFGSRKFTTQNHLY